MAASGICFYRASRLSTSLQKTAANAWAVRYFPPAPSWAALWYWSRLSLILSTLTWPQMHEVIQLYKKSSWLSVLRKFICHVSGWHYSPPEGSPTGISLHFFCVYLLYIALFESMLGNSVVQVLYIFQHSIYVSTVNNCCLQTIRGVRFKWYSGTGNAGWGVLHRTSRSSWDLGHEDWTTCGRGAYEIFAECLCCHLWQSQQIATSERG